jgi:hypothetical protein
VAASELEAVVFGNMWNSWGGEAAGFSLHLQDV